MSTTPATRDPAAPPSYTPTITPLAADPAPAPGHEAAAREAAARELTARLDRLERRAPSGKDAWDVLQIVGSALIPVAIAAGGWFYSEASSRAQIENARQQHERDAEIAASEARVRQAGLLKDFLDALTGPDVAKQRVAIQAVLLALPQDGPKLVRELSQSSADSGVAQYARESLQDRRDVLIRQLFAPTSEERRAASAVLVEGWRDNPVMLGRLLAYARQHAGDANGLFNTLGVLTQVSAASLVARRPDVEAFLADAAASPVAGPQIRGLVGEVRARLR